jgi:hypothetical protein
MSEPKAFGNLSVRKFIRWLRNINLKKESRDRRNWVIIGMTSFGTITALLALLAEKAPEIQSFIRGMLA